MNSEDHGAPVTMVASTQDHLICIATFKDGLTQHFNLRDEGQFNQAHQLFERMMKL